MNTWLVLVLIIAAAIFVVAILDNRTTSYCPYSGGECYDGNGKYLYKGRGYKKESVEELLSRIDWLAKNSKNKLVFTSSYIIAFPISLAILIVLYGYNGYCLSAIEYIMILMIVFIVVFSTANLFDFHNERYSAYYIRKNVEYIADKLNVDINTPNRPHHKSCVPHRTKVRDKLSY